MATIRKRRNSMIGVRESLSFEAGLNLFQRDAEDTPSSCKKIKLKMVGHSLKLSRSHLAVPREITPCSHSLYCLFFVQSPFPEVQGEELYSLKREIEGDYLSRKGRVSRNPLKIAVATAVEGTTVSPSLLRPSEVKTLERKMAGSQQLQQQQMHTSNEKETTQGIMISQ